MLDADDGGRQEPQPARHQQLGGLRLHLRSQQGAADVQTQKLLGEASQLREVVRRQFISGLRRRLRRTLGTPSLT